MKGTEGFNLFSFILVKHGIPKRPKGLFCHKVVETHQQLPQTSSFSIIQSASQMAVLSGVSIFLALSRLPVPLPQLERKGGSPDQRPHPLPFTPSDVQKWGAAVISFISALLLVIQLSGQPPEGDALAFVPPETPGAVPTVVMREG